MDRIRDLRGVDGREDAVVTDTSGGLLDAQYLSGEPPVSYLEPDEQPQFVLRNKKSGVECTAETGTTTTEAPDSDHQALAVVTGCRVLFLVGHAGGDHVTVLAHDELVEARTESSGFMTSTLLVETGDGERYRFPCRGDVSEVVKYVDDTVQTWTTASRLVDEASERVDAGREALDAADFAEARAVLTDVTGKITSAREHVSTVGDGARTALEARAKPLIDRLHRLEREIAAMSGARHHATAQEAWKTDHDFERAASEYERGAEEYERALGSDGDTPTDEALQLRLNGVLKERAVLRAAPMADARAAREVAIAADDPATAAAEWETALTCYREAVTLDWGEADREFVVERERARKRADEAATEALDAHIEAAGEWVAAGDRIVRNGREREARQAYQRAERHFSAARRIAGELEPARRGGIDERLAALERRRTGEVVPAADPAESALSVEAVADRLTAETRHDGAAPTPAIRRRAGDDDPVAGSETAPTAEGGGAVSARAALRGLDEATLTRLVADLWEANGWATTVFSGRSSAVYDVLALRERDGKDERLLLWTAHRPDDALGATVVRRCATTRDSSHGADGATVVTTGQVTSAARNSAAELGVSVIDGATLAAELAGAGLLDRLPE